MRPRHMLAPLLVFLLLLLCLAVPTGCGGSDTSSAATSGPPGPTPETTAATVAGEPQTTAGTDRTVTTVPASTVTLSLPTSSSAGTTSPVPGGMTTSTRTPGAIDPAEIKNAMTSIGMGTPDRLTIYDYKGFGHYAAAYVMAADENVYLVLFNDETGGWAILATYNGLDYEQVKADLRAKGAPQDLIDWADPGDG